ncbi:uncharacterized protein LOC113836465 [Cricetulus griseus]|uniref:Uncharacterized protein LOC113836465 n=1 Tax=Cricetulus griseus TaxID=10029 RepID=A0A9J7H409_CRIGR|nr:uncharacterized protein LOC113836465 [Cricetulus griseus]
MTLQVTESVVDLKSEKVPRPRVLGRNRAFLCLSDWEARLRKRPIINLPLVFASAGLGIECFWGDRPICRDSSVRGSFIWRFHRDQDTPQTQFHSQLEVKTRVFQPGPWGYPDQDPQALTGLIESILITHQPTWDDCQQLLQTLLTTEERQRVLLEARKNVQGPDGRPTQLPNEIDEVFPLIRPTDWDINTAAGRERHRLYRQTLLAGLKGAGRRPTNLAKVRAVVQGLEETPAGFLERLMEAYRMYTPFDPQAQDREADIIMSFIGQSAPDIRTKLQRLEGLQGYTLRDLVKEAEKIFNMRETPEEKEERLQKLQEDRENVRDKKRNQELAKILATVVQGSEHRPGQTGNLGDKRRTRVERNQCAYCKEKGHWVKHCPKNPRRKPTPILPLEKGD